MLAIANGLLFPLTDPLTILIIQASKRCGSTAINEIMKRLSIGNLKRNLKEFRKNVQKREGVLQHHSSHITDHRNEELL